MVTQPKGERLTGFGIPEGATVLLTIEMDQAVVGSVNATATSIEELLEKLGFKNVKVDVELIEILDPGAPLRNWR